jgi:hypothetical protein
MATSGAWIYCSCGHTVPEHGPDGKCRSASGWPCDCQSLDVDDEETE